MERFEDLVVKGKYLNEYHRLSIAFVYVAGLVETYRTKFFRKYGFSAQQFRTLFVLRDHFKGAATIRELKANTIDANPDMPRLIDKLVSMAVVQKRKDKSGTRADLIVITDKGRQLVTEVHAHFSEMLKPLTVLTDEEIKQFIALLEKTAIGINTYPLPET